MASELRAKESGAEGALRIVRAEIRKALEGLRERWPPRDQAIHDARKRLKKARAGLRMLRPTLGAREFRRENQALRDAARPLSELRDSKALIDALGVLGREAAAHEREAIARLRQAIELRRQRVRSRLVGSPRAFEPVIEGLWRAKKRVRRARSGSRGWSVLGRGVRRVYGAGRDAFARARRQPSVENLHEWRKQTKYLWHQLQVLHPIRPALMTRAADRAHRLSDRLGDDHDLAVLRNQVTRAPSRLPRLVQGVIVRLVDRRRRRLQGEAIDLGRRVFEERPRQFVGRLETHWRAWRSRARGS